MKGKNLVKTPGELYAPTQNGVVVSADGVKDYKQDKNQEEINLDLINRVKTALDIAEDVKQHNDITANIINYFKSHENEDLGDVLSLHQRVEDNTTNIVSLQNKINGYTIVVLTESEYEALEEKDENTLYFIEEVD